MDYVVWPLRNVTVRLAEETVTVQREFERIASVLAPNPYPNPQFPWITEDRVDDSTRVYTYSDREFPFVVQFVVFEPTDADYGMIAVIDLIPMPRR